MISRRIRGVILSTEMVLLLTAVIMMAVIAMFGMSKTVLTQATSSKGVLVVLRAEAWKLDTGIGVTVYVSNTGDRPVTITSIKYATSSSSGLSNCKTDLSITINPGESRAISAVCDVSINANTPIFVAVTYQYTEGGTTYRDTVGAPTVVKAPP